jgi:hypothetical protein
MEERFRYETRSGKSEESSVQVMIFESRLVVILNLQ